MMDKLMRYIKHPRRIFVYLQVKCNFRGFSDARYLKICYRLTMGKKLNLENPRTFTEKLQWLKLYDRRPEYTGLVDKYAFKQFVSETIGEEYVLPALGVWDRFDDIDFASLPQQFVLKCTHDSGSVILVKDKEKLDIPAAKRKLEKSLKKNYYYSGREWPYKNVQPRIFAEPYLQEPSGEADGEEMLTDYKFYCFNGVPKMMYIAKDRSKKPGLDYFDMDFVHLPCCMEDDTNAAIPPSKPAQFEKMKELAAILSKDIPHVRVDFYSIDGKLYVGELTFFTCSGFCAVKPDEWDQIMGDMLELPETAATGVRG